MIGDRGIDIGSGRNAGVMTCYLTNGAGEKGDIGGYPFSKLRRDAVRHEAFKKLKDME